MSRNNSIIKFNENELKIIKENIHSIYNKILNTSFKRMFISNVYKIIAYIILALGFFTIMLGIIFLSSLLPEKASSTFYLVIVIIGIIFILVGTLLVTVGQTFSKKIKREFLEYNINYLKMAVNSTFKAVEITNVINNFTIVPQKFLVIGSDFNHRVWTEKVIIGSINDKNFNCGTTLEKITRTYKTGKTTTTSTTYNRYLYFTCLIDIQDVITTIVPETLGSRIMGSNRGDQLESAAFEKLFALDYSDPIKLRKLLVPKVMSKMVDLANAQEKIPRIYVNKNQVTLMFPYMNIGSDNSSTANLLNLVIANSEEKLLENVVEMLNFTLDIIINSYQWVVSLDLSKELLFK